MQNKQATEKSKRTREANREKDPRQVKHFGIWIDSTRPTARISREHYAQIDRRSSLYTTAEAKYLAEMGKSPFVLDENGERGIYSEDWCALQRKRCLRNFDLNMERFASLDSESFNQILLRFTKGRKFQEVHTLDEPICEDVSRDSEIAGCVYIMVFDAYKQVYIGITRSGVKKRIRQHWKKKRAFDRLIFGNVDTSVLSVDSFGPLDTTRIFVLPYSQSRKTPLEDYEYICIKAFDDRYLLNRLR